MAVFLVTGNPGSGKTALTHELTRRGFAALDADVVAEWESTTGLPVALPVQTTDEWLRRHRWVWPRGRIEQLVHEHADSLVFLCGIAMNQREMLDLFSGVFLLALDEDTQIARLDAAGNRDPSQRAQVVTGRPYFQAEMRAAGARVLDGGRPTGWLADRVLQEAAELLSP
jgi:hypothetical protein